MKIAKNYLEFCAKQKKASKIYYARLDLAMQSRGVKHSVVPIHARFSLARRAAIRLLDTQPSGTARRFKKAGFAV